MANLSRMTSRALWTVVLAIGAGLAIGIGGYTFFYAQGASYLTNDPNACANCHVMRQQYEGWIKSSHHSVAVCNDCHTPAGLIPKYATKALNGFWHSFYFTTGGFHEPIQIRERNRKITEQACRKCHATIVEAIEGRSDGHYGNPGEIQCLQCHNSVGHPEALGTNPAVLRSSHE